MRLTHDNRRIQNGMLHMRTMSTGAIRCHWSPKWIGLDLGRLSNSGAEVQKTRAIIARCGIMAFERAVIEYGLRVPRSHRTCGLVIRLFQYLGLVTSLRSLCILAHLKPNVDGWGGEVGGGEWLPSNQVNFLIHGGPPLRLPRPHYLLIFFVFFCFISRLCCRRKNGLCGCIHTPPCPR